MQWLPYAFSSAGALAVTAVLAKGPGCNRLAVTFGEAVRSWVTEAAMNRTNKRDATIYWLTTGTVCVVMMFSAVNFNLKEPLGPMKGAFTHLGYPSYFRLELTAAKALGVLALLVPGVPRKAKEFAYFGFAVTLVSASIAHFSVGDPALFVIDPLLFLTALVGSYALFLSRGGDGTTAGRVLRKTA